MDPTPARKRRAFTIMEILVVLTLMASMTAMAGGVFTGATNYFKSRGSAETLLWDVRRIQEIARTRGIGPTNHGVIFYKGQWDFGNNAPSNIGWSYFVYGVNGAPKPPDSFSSLTPEQGRQLVSMAPTIQFVRHAVRVRCRRPGRRDLAGDAGPVRRGGRMVPDPRRATQVRGAGVQPALGGGRACRPRARGRMRCR
jgi:type II secretory pathway pseudopilin PulG